MPTAQPSYDAQVGLALSSFGTPAANPAYVLPLYGGLPYPTQTFNPWVPPIISGVVQNVVKGTEAWQMQVETPVFPASILRLAQAILWSDSVAGTGPYTHTLTPGTTPQFATVFSKRPGTLYERWDNAVIDGLTLSFDSGGQPLHATWSGAGTSGAVISAYTPGATETMGTGTYYARSGGTLKVDFATTPATTTRTNITSGALRLVRPSIIQPDARNAPAVRVDRKALGVEVALEMFWTDWDSWRAAFYGGVAGSAMTATVVFGSIDWTFVLGTNSIRLQVPKVAFQPDPIQPDPSGAGLRVTATGLAVKGAGEIITTTIVNGLST